MGRVGFYLYGGDWQKDTRVHTLEVKGAWIDLLIILNENGGSVTWPIDGYARLWGVSAEEAERIIDQLEQFKTAEVEKIANQQNVNKILTKVSNRKMERQFKKEQHIKQVRSEAGKISANKKQQKTLSSYSYSNSHISNITHKNELYTASLPGVEEQKNEKSGVQKFRPFTDMFTSKFSDKFGEKYHFRHAIDAQAAKRLVSKYGIDKLDSLTDAFFESSDKFIQDSGYTIGVFESQINKLAINGKSKSVPKGWDVVKRFKERHGGK